jgi:hypothetical protein
MSSTSLRATPSATPRSIQGFSADISWVYRVPEGADITGFYAVDVTDFSADQDAALWRLNV